MTTSSAQDNGWQCPRCGDDTTRDPSGKGFVRHKTNADCQFERGLRDRPARLEPRQSGGRA